MAKALRHERQSSDASMQLPPGGKALWMGGPVAQLSVEVSMAVIRCRTYGARSMNNGNRNQDNGNLLLGTPLGFLLDARMRIHHTEVNDLLCGGIIWNHLLAQCYLGSSRTGNELP